MVGHNGDAVLKCIYNKTLIIYARGAGSSSTLHLRLQLLWSTFSVIYLSPRGGQEADDDLEFCKRNSPRYLSTTSSSLDAQGGDKIEPVRDFAFESHFANGLSLCICTRGDIATTIYDLCNSEEREARCDERQQRLLNSVSSSVDQVGIE